MLLNPRMPCNRDLVLRGYICMPGVRLWLSQLLLCVSAYCVSRIQQRLLNTLLGRITKTDIGSGGERNGRHSGKERLSGKRHTVQNSRQRRR